MEHPIWISLNDLLEKKDGNSLAEEYLKEEFTPLEFLSACASQAQFSSSWKVRVEMMKGVKYAIEKGGKRVQGFAESIFKELINFSPYDEKSVIQIVEIFIDCLQQSQTDPRSGTQILFKCLYDPILIRIENTEAAKSLGKRIIDIIELDYETFTIQEILLFSAFREREDIEESDSCSSLSEWDNTSDSTESSIEDKEKECPIECSAACAWILAPMLIDPPVLTPFGRFIWVHRHANFLMNLPSNTLAARRGMELFASFGSVHFVTKYCQDEEFVDDLYTTISSAIKFVGTVQSIEGRNVISNFIQGMEPEKFQIKILLRLSKDTLLAPPFRGYSIDLLRNIMNEDNCLSISQEIIKLIMIENQDFDILSACFSFVRVIAIQARNSSRLTAIAKNMASNIYDIVTSVLNSLKHLEEELDVSDSFQLRVPLNPNSPNAIAFSEQPPMNSLTPQANYGRARLVRASAEILLQNWQPFFSS